MNETSMWRDKRVYIALVVLLLALGATVWVITALSGNQDASAQPSLTESPEPETSEPETNTPSEEPSSEPETSEPETSEPETGGEETAVPVTHEPATSNPTSNPVISPPRFLSFDYVPEVDCQMSNGIKPPLSISWSSSGAVKAYWTPSTNPANANNGAAVATNGNQTNLTWNGEARGVFQECNHRETYSVTITLVGSNGATVSRTATFTDTSWGMISDLGPKIQTFSGPSTAGCLSAQAPAYEPLVDLTFTWSVEHAQEVAFGIATMDAIAAPYQDGLPWMGTITVNFGCNEPEQHYTLTISDHDNHRISRTITVTNPSYGQ